MMQCKDENKPDEERVISIDGERAYRLVHHDFGGKTVEIAAEAMGVSTRQVQRLLAEVKRQAPQLWPILTHRQAKLWRLWLEGGLSVRAIADELGLSEGAVTGRLRTIKKNLGWTDTRIGQRPRIHHHDRMSTEERDIYLTF